MDWRNRSVRCHGSVLFRGRIAPRLEEFGQLQKAGVRVEPRQGERAHWVADLEHPRWGRATAVCLRDPPTPPRAFIVHDARLSRDEKEQALAGGPSVSVACEGTRSNVLRDRKTLLQFLHCLTGDDGVVAIDHTAMRCWSPEALVDETCHDAEPDIDALFTLHAVGSDDADRPTWLHTHGLADVGFFDFDILNPSEGLFDRVYDAVRAIAFAVVEGAVKTATPRYEFASPGGEVRFVEVGRFNRSADAATAALRVGADEDHNRQRSVVCEPAGGLLGRWFRRPRPSRWLSGPMDGEVVLQFSTAASQLMAERARGTYGMFRRLADELAEFGFPIIAKLGYPVDGGGADNLEHLWFTAHALHDGRIDATLESEPFDIAAMKLGERGEHPVEQLTDWAILTPLGMVTPRDTTPARVIRRNREEFRRLFDEHRKQAAEQA